MANIEKPATGTSLGFSFNANNGVSPKNNRFTINADKTLYFNGERLGMNDLETDYLKRKLNEENAAKASVVVEVFNGPTPVSMLDKDSLPAQLTVRVTTKFNGTPVDSNSSGGGTFTIGGKSASFTKKQTGVYECVIYKGEPGSSTPQKVYYNGTFTVMATCYPNSITKTGSKTVAAYHKIRFGVSALAELTTTSTSQDAMAGFTTRGPQSGAGGTYDFTFTDNTYAYVMVPTDVSLPNSLTGSEPQGVEGPLPVPFKKMNDFVWNGVTYKQFRIASPQKASTHKIVFK
ncbi:hypothetical protein EVA_04113 [gut metagenome]|uniref:Uncharacterized protein n=1 Tax=gut metagenome TaxID=749906 RepID=J9GXF6_9ZZZZ